MLLYFVALLTGKGRLSAILHDLEQTQDRLVEFLDGQQSKSVALAGQIRELSNQRNDLDLETRRARIVSDNLRKLLGGSNE